MNSGEECKPRMREFRIRRRKKEKKKRDKTENTGRTSHLTATPESLKINSKNPRRKNDEYPKKAIIDSKESLVWLRSDAWNGKSISGKLNAKSFQLWHESDLLKNALSIERDERELHGIECLMTRDQRHAVSPGCQSEEIRHSIHPSINLQISPKRRIRICEVKLCCITLLESSDSLQTIARMSSVSDSGRESRVTSDLRNHLAVIAKSNEIRRFDLLRSRRLSPHGSLLIERL